MRYESTIRAHFDVMGTAGDEFICRCRWHEDAGKPNLYINATKGCFLCHVCGHKGHLNSLEKLPPMQTEDLRDRLKTLKTPVPRPVPKPEGWLRQFGLAHPAWQTRLSDPIITKFQLGYDPMTDSLTIPFRDEYGVLYGVIQRRLDDQKPKYRYPRGIKIGRYLFGAWVVPPDQKKVALVEGSVDAMACWEARVPALGLLGSRLSDDQVRVLQRLGIRHVVTMTDADKAGQAAIPQIIEALSGTGIAVSIGVYRPYWNVKDPADLTPTRRRKIYHSAKLSLFSP